ncbi:MAG: hypothetical protein EBS05_24130 [Proteobacteria bacterium]|nr:hypothetical protein [Pseudomonadota bacterium]NDF01524.1 hypothetical protein [Verrucomicrobiota bacterium]
MFSLHYDVPVILFCLPNVPLQFGQASTSEEQNTASKPLRLHDLSKQFNDAWDFLLREIPLDSAQYVSVKQHPRMLLIS